MRREERIIENIFVDLRNTPQGNLPVAVYSCSREMLNANISLNTGYPY
jgi:hypothetical protein